MLVAGGAVAEAIGGTGKSSPGSGIVVGGWSKFIVAFSLASGATSGFGGVAADGLSKGIVLGEFGAEAGAVLEKGAAAVVTGGGGRGAVGIGLVVVEACGGLLPFIGTGTL